MAYGTSAPPGTLAALLAPSQARLADGDSPGRSCSEPFARAGDMRPSIWSICSCAGGPVWSQFSLDGMGKIWNSCADCASLESLSVVVLVFLRACSRDHFRSQSVLNFVESFVLSFGRESPLALSVSCYRQLVFEGSLECHPASVQDRGRQCHFFKQHNSQFRQAPAAVDRAVLSRAERSSGELEADQYGWGRACLVRPRSSFVLVSAVAAFCLLVCSSSAARSNSLSSRGCAVLPSFGLGPSSRQYAHRCSVRDGRKT